MACSGWRGVESGLEGSRGAGLGSSGISQVRKTGELEVRHGSGGDRERGCPPEGVGPNQHAPTGGGGAGELPRTPRGPA